LDFLDVFFYFIRIKHNLALPFKNINNPSEKRGYDSDKINKDAKPKKGKMGKKSTSFHNFSGNFCLWETFKKLIFEVFRNALKIYSKF